METQQVEMFNRTGKNYKDNSGQETKNNAEIALRPVWQWHLDDYRTYCGIVSFSKEKEDV